MTDPIAPSDHLLSLDELSLLPDVALRGPGRPAPSVPGTAAVDGVAVIFFDPTTHSPHLVFVSDGLVELLGRDADELLGSSPAAMFTAEDAGIELSEIRRGLSIGVDGAPGRPMPPGPPAPPEAPGPPAPPMSQPLSLVDLDDLAAVTREVTLSPDIDLSADGFADSAPVHPRYPGRDSRGSVGPMNRPATDPRRPATPPDPGSEHETTSTGDRDGPDDSDHGVSSASRRYTTTQTLRRGDGRSVLVHATYTTVPSMTPVAPYVIVQYRDLARAEAESLLADQAAVIGSLSRGHELGRLCHQVVADIEADLDDGSRCWLGVVNADGLLEPVISGDLPFEDAAEIMRIVADSGSATSKRVVPVDGLPGRHGQLLRTRVVKALWYVPMAGTGGMLRGALVVATAQDRPDQAITRSLDHLAAVMATAVEHATAEADIAHQTLHDPLTQLPNRALIVDRLGQAMARLERDGIALSVLLVDIDRFRTVNDTRGIEVGDQVLLEVAGRLLAAVRLGDTVGRISSDQYLVMCVATSGELDAAAVGRRILRSLAEPITVGEGDDLHITASVGVVVVDEPGPSPAVIIGNAESALARASATGRGQMAMFEADLRRHVVDRHQTEQALHRAITAEQLVIHYQPLVEIRTGFMVGAEALVRWDRPGHGLLYPPSFIQIAEESELILPMGNWIIDKVCRDLGGWPKSHGRSPMVTINLAARQLAVDTLVPTVVSALQRNGLHPTRVGFEITESMEIRDLDAAGVNLNRLSELGCRIAIDDFGIGHATLDYIRRFSMADALKIDRSFVAGLASSKEDRAIVNASIALAESLGLQVIAEGVENVDQLTTLEEMGCRYAQGFGLARPVPLDEVLELWQKARLFEPLRL